MKQIVLLLFLFLLNACREKKDPQPNLPPKTFNVSTQLSGTDLILTWTKAEDPDGDAVSYSVVYGDTLVKGLSNTTYTIKNVPYNTEIKGSVVATDSKGLSTSVIFTIKTGDKPHILIPDSNFEQALIDLKIDDVKDGKVSVENVLEVTNLELNNRGITDLNGIEAFTNLVGLHCQYNELKTLDLSKNINLTYINAMDNQLTTLDLSKNINLKHLFLNNNQLISLNVSKSTDLIYLYVSHNKLATLDISKNVNLQLFGCENNHLVTLDISKNVNLELFICQQNELATLDVSKNVKLSELICRHNLIREIDLTKNSLLTTFICNNNQLSTLNLTKNILLKNLNINDNKLSILDISENINLEQLSCKQNHISTICVRSLNDPKADWKKDNTSQYKVCD